MPPKSASSRVLRICALGLATITAAAIFTTSAADARRAHHRHRHHHHRSHHEARHGYNPAFSSIIVDANSGATLESNNPDGLRFPASLTKVMTLYLLFERLDAGKLTLDSELPVSEHASEQAPTKLGLRPGQSIRVEDAIKGIVTRSANDAAVVIGEALGGDEDDFAKMMTRKARSLGMTRTVYRNASGLPNDDQVTTARDQSILARAIQDRFPRYYRYFATTAFRFRGHVIRGHNHLLGSVDGVDGIKTGYTRASGFNLMTNLRRGNRHIVGVVMGGRSARSRDNAMRALLAENLDKSSPRRTVAAIAERSPAEANAAVAEDAATSRPAQPVQVKGAIQVASPAPESAGIPTPRPAPTARAVVAAAAAAVPAEKPEPAPLTSGVIETQTLAIPGSTAPMKPIHVKTVHIRAGQVKVASTGPVAPTGLPPQPANHGTGHGLLGVLPASSFSGSDKQTVASADSATRVDQPAVQRNGAIKPVASHSGWIIQVGALDSESEARVRLEKARERARGMLRKADPFTEPVVTRNDKTLYRARFAGLERDEADAVCRRLKRSDMSCITIKN